MKESARSLSEPPQANVGATFENRHKIKAITTVRFAEVAASLDVRDVSAV
jgi:hypothetical protein